MKGKLFNVDNIFASSKLVALELALSLEIKPTRVVEWEMFIGWFVDSPL